MNAYRKSAGRILFVLSILVAYLLGGANLMPSLAAYGEDCTVVEGTGTGTWAHTSHTESGEYTLTLAARTLDCVQVELVNARIANAVSQAHPSLQFQFRVSQANANIIHVNGDGRGLGGTLVLTLAATDRTQDWGLKGHLVTGTSALANTYTLQWTNDSDFDMADTGIYYGFGQPLETCRRNGIAEWIVPTNPLTGRVVINVENVQDAQAWRNVSSDGQFIGELETVLNTTNDTVTVTLPGPYTQSFVLWITSTNCNVMGIKGSLPAAS